MSVPLCKDGPVAGTGNRPRAIALLPAGDRFEDFHDRIGVTLEDLREGLSGTWLFNYVEALHAAGVRPVLYFVSARVPSIVRFTHQPTGASIRFLPTPWLHRKMQGARDRFGIPSPLFASLLSYAATPWLALVKEFRRDDCEAILCQEYEYPRFDEAVVVGRLLRMPVFATYQGGSASRSGLERPFRRISTRLAAGLIIGARKEIERVRTAYGVPAERTGLVPNGLDVETWQPLDRHVARAALGIADDTRVVVWHGRVEIDCKGLDLLLDAWEQLCVARPHARLQLLLVGSGRDHDALNRRIASLPADSVRWDDRWVRDRNVIWRYLSAADIAVLSSRREGFPVAVVEAMTCGLPVVATNVSGVIDALGDELAGVVVPPEDAPALAAALGRLLDDDPLRRELGQRARRRAEREFSLQRVGSRLRAFMEARGAFREWPRLLGRSVEPVSVQSREDVAFVDAPDPAIDAKRGRQ
jgi:glycosyltransferase involved in cell wall biosynthesis